MRKEAPGISADLRRVNVGDGEYAGLEPPAAAVLVRAVAATSAAAGGIADPRIPPPRSSSSCSSRVEFWSLMGVNAGGSRSGTERGGNVGGGGGSIVALVHLLRCFGPLAYKHRAEEVAEAIR